MACTFQSNFIKPDPNTLHINTWIKLNHKETKEWGNRIRSEGVHLLYKFNKEILKSFGISYSDTNWTLDLSLNKEIRAKNNEKEKNIFLYSIKLILGVFFIILSNILNLYVSFCILNIKIIY